MKQTLLLLLLLIGNFSVLLHAQQTIDLSGQWDFCTGDVPKFTDHVRLPGSMLTNGKGNLVDVHTPWTGSLYDSSYYFNPYMERYRQPEQMKFPFFLTPDRHYVGTAWYRRTVDVPKSWRGQRVVLTLERPHIETTVTVNGHEVGHQTSLSIPHQYDVTNFVRFGRRNELVIRVYNGIENVGVGQDSHSVTDQTQGNWNGIVGRIELTTRPLIDRIRVFPDIPARAVTLIVNEQTYRFELGDSIELWDEFHPRLYTRTVSYHGTNIPVTFGIREVSTNGRDIVLNGHTVWMRGTVENCCFPETGFPPTDEAAWTHLFEKCKEYGLNHVRFHSYCPPEAAFAAADRVGIYLQPEGPSWPNHGVRLRRGQPIDKYLLDESKRIVDTYGHHPSFLMMAAGNEPAGDWVTYCNEWVRTMQQYDPTKIYCGASVGGGWAWDDGSQYHVKGGARGLDWDRSQPQSQDDYADGIAFPRNYKSTEPNQTPILAHEQGQWCAFPDLTERSQYTGVYKARNFDIFADFLQRNGMAGQARNFLDASGRLQVLCYKYEIERNLRTNGYAGFQLLALNDYSGQGTALVGPLNVHWREKGYVDAAQWREFCAPLVPLARFPRFVFENTDTLRIPIEFYNACGATTEPMRCIWTIDGEDISVGDVLQPRQRIAVGKGVPCGTVIFPLSQIQQPTKLTLSVFISAEMTGKEIARNHWDFWVYPQQTEAVDASDILITDSLDTKAVTTLQNGGTVLITAAGRVRLGSDVVQHYLPVFWNTSWFKMRPPHTTGAFIDTSHPLFRHGFPTDSWSNLNWWELLNRAQVMNFMDFPADYQPPVQPIDTWHVSRKLGMMFEAHVLNGRLLMTTFDISSNLDQRIVARQMRHALLDYMTSDDFQPTLRLPLETVSRLFTDTAPPVNMFTNDSPDELKPKIQ